MKDRGTIVIRADAGGQLGTGHVMRMIALAQAWQDGGGKVIFACATCPPAVLERLEKEGFVVLAKDLKAGSADDLAWTQQLAGTSDAQWVVLDGYHFLETFQKALCDHCIRVMAVDDCGHCGNWAAHAVLNGNLHAEPPPQMDAASAVYTVFLSGPRFALLRREFQANPNLPAPDPEKRLRILITFGGVDPPGAALRIVRALAPIASCRSLHVRVLTGAANPRAAEFAKLAARHPQWLEAKSAVDDMPGEYAWADRIISAGGSSCLEWLRYRKPGWVVSIAGNQQPIIAALEKQNLAATGGRMEDFPDDASLAAALETWLDQEPAIPRPVVDAWGAARVAAWLDGSNLLVRPVDPRNEADVRFLFDLANETTVRKAGFHNDSIPWETHLDWVKRNSESVESMLLCGEHHDLGPCASVRFHRRSKRDWEIGVAVIPSARSKGIAREAVLRGIRLLRESHPHHRIIATVKPENAASLALFRSLGFVQTTNIHTNFGLTFELV